MAAIQRMHVFGIGAVMWLFVLSTQGLAALDTSGPVICAFQNAFDCDSSKGCEATSPEDIGLPVFFKLDLANNKVVAASAQQTENRRETVIKGVNEADGKLFLQGVERRGWNLVVDKETGQMSLAASAGDEAIVLFGNCTAP
jgi:hypothetical protein